MLDVRITGGKVVDGTGAPSRHGDIGVRDGRIVQLGTVDEPARRTIDADGMVVAPGFIDIHTHYDAQALWDPTMSPSPLHGVTTVLGGNCGFTIAPMRPSEVEYLMRMLARVEGMPLAALQAGSAWDWTSTAEYFGRLRSTLAVNAGFMVGHSTMRRVVMGDDAVGKPATADQLAAMVALLREGLAAGAIGFSTSLGTSHQDADGNPVPSRHASTEEFVTLARVCRDFAGTSLEFVPSSGPFTDEERSLFTAMSSEAARPVNWNSLRPSALTLDDDRQALDVGTWAHAHGGKIVGLAMPVDFPARYSFLTPFILDGLPGWAGPMALPVPERLAVLRNAERRRELDALAQSKRDVRFAHADWKSKLIVQTFDPELAHYEGRLVGDIAAESGKDPFDALLDIVCADELRTTFSRVPTKLTAADWDARLEIWRDPRTALGGSDAGAHLDFTANFYYPTYMLATVARDEGLMSLEETIRMLTSDPADLYGLHGRGRLEVGAHADLVVFDETSIDVEPVVTRFDLPSGAGRLYAGATGIGHVVVNGEEIVRDGEFTDARPGTVLQSGRDTRTPSLTW